ncbi:MAG: hypothetical protein IIC79_04870 [Chloroflexi bacterium]|nr:hypothetical protein [Chloroflexota bacterium]
MKKIVVVMLFMLSCNFLQNIQSGDQPSGRSVEESPADGAIFTDIQPALPSTAVAPDVNTPTGILFQDDFSDPNSGWDHFADADGSTDYQGGQYVIVVTAESLDLFANPGSDYPGDIIIEVTADKIGGVDDNNFGIICRYQDTGNYYEFLISSDGYFAIIKMTDRSGTFIGADGWAESSVIHTGDAVNTIRVECVGNTLRLFANGALLLQAQDSTFSGGDVGLIAGTFDVPGTIIAFDDFVVYAAE